MGISLQPFAHRLAAAAGRIAVAILPLSAALILITRLVPAPQDHSDPQSLVMRIAAGVAFSALTLGLIALLTRAADHEPMSAAGLTPIRSGWRLSLWGAVLWTVPAAAAFALLALLGAPVSATVPAPELLQIVLLLLLAVLLGEALPEEAVFRGYLTKALGMVASGWWAIIIQAVMFTVFAGIMRQNWNITDLSLFLTMGIGFGYLRMLTGSVWLSIGFHTAFQTSSQLVLSHDAVSFAGDTGTAMLALGVVPFTLAGILVSTTRLPRFLSGRERAPL